MQISVQEGINLVSFTDNSLYMIIPSKLTVNGELADKTSLIGVFSM